METNNFFEQAANISKAHGYDILAKQVGELKESNKELIKRLEEIRHEAEKINAHTWETYKGQILHIVNNEMEYIKKAKILSL